MHRVAKKKRFAKNIYVLIVTTRALFYSVQSVVSIVNEIVLSRNLMRALKKIRY